MFNEVGIFFILLVSLCIGLLSDFVLLFYFVYIRFLKFSGICLCWIVDKAD